MPETRIPVQAPRDEPAEIARLNKIIHALMDRAERSSASAQPSDFSLLQSTVMLEEQVRRRTSELEAALRENEKTHRALLESEAKFHGLVEQSLVGITIVEQGKFTYTNAKFDEIFGYSEDEILGLGPLDVTIESDRALVEGQMRMRLNGDAERVRFEFRGLRKDGVPVDVEVHGAGMEVNGKMALISVILDITERVRAEREVKALQEKLRDQAVHDPLTGLHNRRYLDDALDRELILAHREGHSVSLILGDLDHFKQINDTYGHLAGDEVLRVFGALMRSQARGSDINCRYGGEEFLLVLPRMGRQSAVDRAEQLRCDIAAAPVAYGTSTIPVTASFGVSVFPQDGSSVDELIAAADRGLYAAKGAGRNRIMSVPPRV